MLDNLLYALDVFQFQNKVEFKEAEINSKNTIKNIKVIYGNENYQISGLTEIEYDAISSKSVNISSPTKSQGIVGIQITFESELGTEWSKTFLSHRSEIYEQDDLLSDLQ